MKKDFNAALQNSAFDGFSISQTEEEREAEKVSTDSNNVAPVKKQTEKVEPEKSKKQRRISLYMEEIRWNWACKKMRSGTISLESLSWIMTTIMELPMR